MTVIIRDSTPGDVAAITGIYAAYIGTEDLASFEETAPSAAEMGLRREKVLSRGFSFLVAVSVVESAVVGYAYAESFHECSTYLFTATNSVYLHPAHCGKGIGALLMVELLATLAARGCTQVIAVVGSKEDNPGTHALHAKLGFVQVGLLPDVGFKNDKWVSRAYLQLDLADPGRTAQNLARFEGLGGIPGLGSLGTAAAAQAGSGAASPRIAIRDSIPDDAVAIRDVYCACIGSQDAATFEEQPPACEEVARRRDGIESRGFPFLVAVTEEGAVVGCAYADRFRARSAYRFTAATSVCLLPGHRVKGVGARLVVEVLRRLKAGGFRQAVARMVSREQHPGPHRLHQSLGFEPCALVRAAAFKHGRWLDVEEAWLDLTTFEPGKERPAPHLQRGRCSSEGWS
jgi:phosphinothricin acetyltransferase